MICFGCSEEQKEQTENAVWTADMLKTHIANREDSTKWDLEMFQSDLENNVPFALPFSNGVFPVPKYDLLAKNSFKGVGNFAYPGGEGSELKIGAKTILFNSFFVGTNFFNQYYIAKEAKDEVFFHIVVLTDVVDTLNYSHVSSEIVSRNHPDYIGQGFYKTRTNKIDYCAFISADRNSYAIVNMRLFDLKNGRTIVIAPQTDNSFRSMQIVSPPLSSDQIENYTKKLIEKAEIREFLTRKGTI